MSLLHALPHSVAALSNSYGSDGHKLFVSFWATPEIDERHVAPLQLLQDWTDADDIYVIDLGGAGVASCDACVTNAGELVTPMLNTEGVAKVQIAYLTEAGVQATQDVVALYTYVDGLYLMGIGGRMAVTALSNGGVMVLMCGYFGDGTTRLMCARFTAGRQPYSANPIAVLANLNPSNDVAESELAESIQLADGSVAYVRHAYRHFPSTQNIDHPDKTYIERTDGLTYVRSAELPQAQGPNPLTRSGRDLHILNGQKLLSITTANWLNGPTVLGTLNHDMRTPNESVTPTISHEQISGRITAAWLIPGVPKGTLEVREWGGLSLTGKFTDADSSSALPLSVSVASRGLVTAVFNDHQVLFISRNKLAVPPKGRPISQGASFSVK